MNGRARRFVWLNVLGGAAVLASYAWGLSALGDDAGRAWGGVPDWLRPWYERSMVLAALGYFPMTVAVLSALRGNDTGTILSRAATGLYAGILVGSALWLPLTCHMLAHPSVLVGWLIRADLAAVGLSSLSVLALLAGGVAGTGTSMRVAATIGAVAFCVQTALLDAIVWPAYFFS